MIEIWTKISWVSDPNHVIIKLNNDLLFDSYLFEEKLKFENINYLQGENTLTIEVADRNEKSSTVLDSNNEIIKDTFVSIENIFIEDFMLKNFKDLIGNITIDWSKNKNCYQYLKNQGIDTASWCKGRPSYLSLNAVYELKFNYPIDDWLKNIKHLINSKYTFEQLKIDNDKLLNEVKLLVKDKNDNISS